MNRRAAKNMLRGAGLIELAGSHWYVGESRLHERLPDVYDRVYDYSTLRVDAEAGDAV